MLHHELAAPGKQIGQGLLARWTVEHIGLVDLDPGQRAALFAEAIPRPGKFLLMRHMRLAGFDPFLARDDLVRLHGWLLLWA